jgi:hypothetical protein
MELDGRCLLENTVPRFAWRDRVKPPTPIRIAANSEGTRLEKYVCSI